MKKFFDSFVRIIWRGEIEVNGLTLNDVVLLFLFVHRLYDAL